MLKDGKGQEGKGDEVLYPFPYKVWGKREKEEMLQKNDVVRKEEMG